MTENMPFIANPCMVVNTSVKDGLMVPDPPVLPPAAAPKAENPVRSRAAPAMPAAIYETAGTLTVFPLLTLETIQATSSPVSRAFKVNFD